MILFFNLFVIKNMFLSLNKIWIKLMHTSGKMKVFFFELRENTNKLKKKKIPQISDLKKWK